MVKDIQRQSWSKLDCVVFPGGFFRQPEYIGHLPHQDRVKTIEATDFGTTMKDACRELQGQNPGLVIVVGVDSNVHPKRHDYGRDQMCVAWNASGIVGIGRKVFPSPGEGLKYVHTPGIFQLLIVI